MYLSTYKYLLITTFSILLLLFVHFVNAEEFNVILLGTGNPDPQAEKGVERFGPSVLVEVANKKLLFDAGRGVAIRLRQYGVTARDLDAVFITHMHADHISDIDDLWLSGWGLSPFGRRIVPFELYGPEQIRAFMDALAVAYSSDIALRRAIEKPPEEGLRVKHTTIKSGIIYNEEGVIIKAFDVNHGPVKPAFGFKVEYNNASVVISGDTAYSDNLVDHAKDTDLLIHEVAAAAPELFEVFPPAKAIYTVHSSPEDVARVLQKVQPKTAVLTHIITLENETVAPLTTQQILNAVQKNYKNKVLVGEDLMRFNLFE